MGNVLIWLMPMAGSCVSSVVVMVSSVVGALVGLEVVGSSDLQASNPLILQISSARQLGVVMS